MTEVLQMRQYAYEAKGWVRLLTFFSNEIVYLKTRLSEVLESDTKPHALDHAEKLQEDFLTQDKIIALLTSELKDQIRLLDNKVYERDGTLQIVINNQKRLRVEMNKSAGLFLKIKKEFTEYQNKA